MGIHLVCRSPEIKKKNISSFDLLSFTYYSKLLRYSILRYFNFGDTFKDYYNCQIYPVQYSNTCLKAKKGNYLIN